MKKIKRILIAVPIFFVIFMAGHITYLNYLASADTYPADNFLLKESNKTALIIVAHDDDAISMSGTISLLSEKGWLIKELCFYQGWKGNDSTRKKNLESAASYLGMAVPQYKDIELRKDSDQVEKPWLPIAYSQFDSIYNKDSAQQFIQDFILQNRPSVIFTLDDIIGGYGHPDHVFISKLVMELCQQHQNDSLFSVKKIYQAVFDPKMNEKILKDMEAFQLAKTVYQVRQSPKPDVAISLTGREEIKKTALLSFTTEQNSLTKIWPFYNLYPAKLYFGIFDKEYYRVLEQDNNYR